RSPRSGLAAPSRLQAPVRLQYVAVGAQPKSNAGRRFRTSQPERCWTASRACRQRAANDGPLGAGKGSGMRLVLAGCALLLAAMPEPASAQEGCPFSAWQPARKKPPTKKAQPAAAAPATATALLDVTPTPAPAAPAPEAAGPQPAAPPVPQPL